MGGGLTLLAPIGLAALIALAVIVVIHMRRRTPPTLSLPSLRFWEPVRVDASDRRRLRRPPITPLLILQLVAATLVALALARPAIPALPGMGTERTAPQHTIVLLDGSTSMMAVDREGATTTKWDGARDEVMGILDQWQAGDVVTVMTVGSRIETSSASTAPQVDRLRERLERSRAPGGIADIDAALELASDLVLPDRSNRVVLVTDGAVRANPQLAAAIAAPIELRTVGADADQLPNAAITSVGSRPVAGTDTTYRLSFSVASFADEVVRLPYRVRADSVDVVESAIDLQPGQTRSVEVTLPGGAQVADVLIDVRDGFAADNRAAVLLEGSGSAGLDVLLLSDAPAMLERALGALPDAHVDVFPATTPGVKALAAGYDLTVFEGAVPAADDLPETPMLFVRPLPIGDRFASTGVMPAPVIDQFAAGSPVLDGVDLAGVTFGETPAYTLVEGEEALVRGSGNGQTGPLVWQGQIGDFRYVALGFDLGSSNLTQRVAFPVLIARAVSAITAAPMPGSVALGTPLLYQASANAETVTVSDPTGFVAELEVPADVGSVLFEGTGQAGMYTVVELGEGGQELSTSAFMVNAGDPVESDLRPNADLAASLQGGEAATGDLAERQSLADLWPILVAVVMSVVALEWMVFAAGRVRWPRLRLATLRRGGTS